VIATAPQKRLAIKTFVSRFSDGIIREALLREFKRGGQVYFLHNEVDTIENMRDKLAKLLPEARIVVGHGQMNERELERVMRDFTQQRANLLLCTTIIETGIDNPHANTIVINRADKFGLAQLHQLRGRVGRSHHQAYAYLLTHDDAKPHGKQARQRLEAIQMMDELGAGFYLAMHDLEIRGAGEVLGENQSGEMQEVGFNLYTEMLKRAVAALKGRARSRPDCSRWASPPRSTCTRRRCCPATTAPDVHERLTLYKRLANCARDDECARCRKNWSTASANCRRSRGPARQPPPAPAEEKFYYEGAAHDCLNYKALVENEPDVKRIVVFDVLGADALMRLPRDLYDAWLLSIITPLVEVARDDTKIFEAVYNRNNERELFKVPFDIPENRQLESLDWSRSNLEALFEIGYQCARRYLVGDGKALRP
jgi:hypothetical protein